MLRISKIATLFMFQHEFGVENKDIRRTTPLLDGFATEGYIDQQVYTERRISEFLEKQGLCKLTLPEMEEVIGGLNLPDNNIFGLQMTVENALFRDVYGFCEQ